MSPSASPRPSLSHGRTGTRLAADLGLLIPLTAVYFGAAKLGLSMAFVAEQVTVVWPPTGIALAAALVLGLRVWPAFAVGAFLANISAGAPAGVAVGIAAGNTMEAILPAWALRRFLDFNPRLDRLTDAVSYVLVAAIAGPAVSATAGVTSLCAGGIRPWAEFSGLWRVWWLGDAASALVVAPPLLALGTRLRTAWPGRPLTEGVAVCSVLALVSLIVFAGGLGADVSAHPLEYVLFPFVVWAAVRLGPPGTAAVVFVASAVAVWGTRSGLGPFASGTVHESLFLLQAYMTVISVTGLVLAAVIAEWKATERRRAVEHAVTEVLAQSPVVREAGPALLRAVCVGAGWDVGALWLVGADDRALRCHEFWKGTGGPADEFERDTRDRRFESGTGLPGRVWATGRPTWLVDAPADPNFPRAKAAAASGLRSGFAFPIVLADRVLGVIEFFSRDRRTPDARLLAMMAAVGSQFGQFIERRRAEQALDAARRQLQIVTDTMSAAVTRCSRDFRYVWVSKRYAEWIGRPPEEIAGRPIAEIIGDRGFAALRPHFDRVLSGEPVEYETLVDFKGPGGRWVHAVYMPTVNETRAVDGWVAVVHDVTEQKRAEEALREAGRRKDEFLAMLAHELRNPLAPIRTAADLLRLRGDDPAVVGHAAGVIHRQVGHMTRLVEDLLDVSRITRGKIALQRERLDLARLARMAEADHRQGFADAGVSLVVRAAGAPVWTSADPTRVTQVFDNLLGNARKFSDRGGTVTVDVSADAAGGAVLRVTDTGIGIEPEMLPRVFDVFSQADRSLDRSRGGLGLGLTLVKGLVELHGGRVEAKSAGPGRGSEFTVWLPLDAGAPAAAEAVPDDPDRWTPLRVLVVEDNRDAADTLKSLLEALGHRVAVAYTGPAGVAAAVREPPDVVVCDIGLPGMDGYAVARRLREVPETAGVRLIAVTGYGQNGDRDRALAAGFDGHLVKPADLTSLLSHLGPGAVGL